METNQITGKVIGAAVAVHRRLGPGLLESAYEACLSVELLRRGLRFQRQKRVLVDYDGEVVRPGYRIDFLVEREVLIEVKAVAQIQAIHVAQALTYLKSSGCRVALLINFNVPVLVKGIRRLIADP